MGGTRLEQSSDLSRNTANPPNSAAQSGAFSTPFCPDAGAVGGAADAVVERPADAVTDPDLALIVARWPELPEATKAAILAMVREAGWTA